MQVVCFQRVDDWQGGCNRRGQTKWRNRAAQSGISARVPANVARFFVPYRPYPSLHADVRRARATRLSLAVLFHRLSATRRPCSRIGMLRRIEQPTPLILSSLKMELILQTVTTQ